MEAPIGKADDDRITPLPKVPPEWVLLRYLAATLARWFGVSEREIAAEVVDAVWAGRLRTAHRIMGATPYSLRYPELPRGLSKIGSLLVVRTEAPQWVDDATFFGDSKIIAKDWAEAAVDRRTGTVGGWELEDGTRERLSIEVLWSAARDYGERRVSSWKKRKALVSPGVNSRLAATGDTTATPAPAFLGIAGMSQNAAPTSSIAPVYRTGMQGRPSSRNLIACELERRRVAGEVLLTGIAEAAALSQWLADIHPQATRTSVKTIRNSLQQELSQAVNEMKARKDRPK